MNLQLIRHHDGYRPDGIFSDLLKDDEATLAAALEHAYGCEDADARASAMLYPGQIFVPKIPPGSYACVRGTHALRPGHPFETFEITGVAGHSGILFHRGNREEDSRGCVLLGDRETHGPDQEVIVNSAVAFERFMALQAGVQSFTLMVVA